METDRIVTTTIQGGGGTQAPASAAVAQARGATPEDAAGQERDPEHQRHRGETLVMGHKGDCGRFAIPFAKYGTEKASAMSVKFDQLFFLLRTNGLRSEFVVA